jgi:hypothetical protein
MPLLSLWSSNPIAIDQLTIEQVVATAGDGSLKDGSECSKELRAFLSEVKSEKLSDYVDRCLSLAFNKGGGVLQDLVNELGRRLDYKVTNGRYQGTTNAIGFDGIWVSEEGYSVVVEVKTTDAYRISLDTIAKYRERLIAANQVTQNSSILVVVGREDTGELEAQIRGSRHAWDIRLISADALIKLVELKEGADGPDTGKKIRSLLTPMEYTRLDRMIDVMFTTAKDVESATEVEADVDSKEEAGDADQSEEDAGQDHPKSTWQFTDYKLIQAKRVEIMHALGRREATALIKKNGALYWNSAHTVRAACTVSKRYTKKGGSPYWYAYHPRWDEFLGETNAGFFVLGCMDRDVAFAIPLNVIRSVLDALSTTGDRYWHLHLTEGQGGSVSLVLPKTKSSLPLASYLLQLGSSQSAPA